MQNLKWAHLPSGACFTRMLLAPHQFVQGSGDDLRNFYYNLRLPENWVRFNSFGKRVPREILLEHGLDPQVHHRLAFQALGTGDTNACCIAQSVHEHILQQGELLKSKRKLQYGRAVPQTSMWQGICLDDLLITKICDHDREVKPGFIPPDDGVAQKKAHDVYEKVGLKRAEHKSFAACTEFRASGAHVDGIVGTAGAPANCRQDLWRLIQKVLDISCITKRVFQRLLAYISFCFQYSGNFIACCIKVSAMSTRCPTRVGSGYLPKLVMNLELLLCTFRCVSGT